MKIILISVLLFFNLCQAEEMQKPDFQFSNRKLSYTSHSYFYSNPNLTTSSYRKGLMISSFHTFIPITIGIFLLTSTIDSQTEFKTAGKLLFGYGLLLGPSIGHFYLKNAKRGYTGLLIRSIGTLLIAGAALGAGLSGLCEYDCPSNDEITRNFLILTIPSAALISWSIVKGFWSLKKSAKELHSKTEKLGLFLKTRNKFKSVQIQLTYSF